MIRLPSATRSWSLLRRGGMWRGMATSTLVASASTPPPVEPKFSESAAFQGRSRTGGALARKPFVFDYYNSDSFQNKKLFSALGSLLVFIVYVGFLREPSDLDEIFNTPPHILTTALERKMLRDKIREKEAKGEDTTLLQAELEYVDVKEAALKVQFSK